MIFWSFPHQNNLKKCNDWRQLETPRWLEETPAAPVADITVVFPWQHGWFHEWMIKSGLYYCFLFFALVTLKVEGLCGWCVCRQDSAYIIKCLILTVRDRAMWSRQCDHWHWQILSMSVVYTQWNDTVHVYLSRYNQYFFNFSGHNNL